MSTSAVQSCKLFQVVMRRLSLFIWFCLMVGPFLVESQECPEHISTSAIFAALSALHTNITNVTDQHSLCEVGLSWTRQVVIFSSGEENPSGKAFATFKCTYSMPSSEWIVLKETVRFNNQTNITAPELAGLPNCTHCNNPGTESFGDQSFCQVDDPPCDPSPCHNGGSCVQTSLRNYSCSCRVFQSGRNCNECSLNKELCNGGNVSTDCTCVCPGRFSGEFCNECSLNKELCNGGTVSNECACVCPEHFTGEYCNECSVTTGLCNGGTVSRDCTCVCPGPFSGEFCNVLADVMTSEKPADGVDGKGIPTSDPKDLSFDSIGEKNDSGNTSNLGGDGLGHLLSDLSDLLKCSLNTGSCNGGTVSKDCACVCPERFTGEYCNECSVTTGSCNGGTVSRECTCVCPGPFSGEFCNECALHCANGGTLDTESCTCGCSGGFTGPSCDISASDVSSSEVDTTSYIALYVCVGLAVFFTLVVGSVIVAHFIKKRRRAIIKQKRRSRKHRNSVAPI